MDYVRDTGYTIFHPTSTCRMGPDPNAVVDERLRVRGVAGLRVADASVMPTVVSGNTNAACIMIGEKCAAMLREDARARETEFPESLPTGPLFRGAHESCSVVIQRGPPTMRTVSLEAPASGTHRHMEITRNTS